MKQFIYQSLPSRVVFGRGRAAGLQDEVERLGLSRVLVLSTARQSAHADAVGKALGDKAAGSFKGAVMHTPVEVTDEALRVVDEIKADGIVAIGGGSTTGLGKAIALRTDLPQIVLPTTYAGSEMTPVLGETSNGVKRTQSSPKILPEVVIYDVDLTLTLPASTAGVSGMNAIAHAVEALYAQDRNPVIRLMALEAITALAQALPRIHDDPDDVAAREAALYGAWLCGTCLGAVGMALHHKLCHTLGGSFNLPHAETHTVILPYAVAYNAAVMEDAAALATALGSVDPVEGLLDLNRRIGAPASLAALGMPEDGIDRAAELAMANAYWNPQPLEHEAIRQLIARAYRGDPPARA